MPDGWSLLLDLVITLSAALLLGVLFEKLRQSAIVGYLLAGGLVGPSAAGWVKGANAVQTLSELGVALLLFTIGLEFSFRRLVRSGKVALLGGALQILFVIGAVTGLAVSAGQPLKTAFALGAIISLASTAVVLRLLKDRNELDSNHGKASIGVLLTQDIAVVPLVMLVTAMGVSAASAGAKGATPPGALALNVTLLIAALFLLISLVLPRLLDAKSFAKNRELPILTAICTCMAATWGAYAAGLSPALGAFIAGMLLAESPFADQIRADVAPLKTLFVTLFFASIGMFLNFGFIAQHWGVVAIGVVVVMVGKALLTAGALIPFNTSIVGSLAAGITLSQVGEFSFVLAKVANSGGLLSEYLFQLVISVSVLTLMLTPMVVAAAPKWARRLAIQIARVTPLEMRDLAERERGEKRELSGHAIIVGFGEAGKAAAKEIDGVFRDLMIVDIDPGYVRTAKERGYRATLGDATHADILLHARLPEAKAMIVALPDVRLTRIILRIAKMHAPHVPVAVRSRYHVFADELDMTGADLVVDEEVVVGQTLGARLRGFLSNNDSIPAVDTPGISQR